MNGRTARKLRQIARDLDDLDLAPETGYAPAGRLRRGPSYLDDKGVLQPGAPLRRPTAMTECFRRVYKEAKKLYKGLPPSMCVPEVKEKEAEVPFRVRVADSIRKFHAQ